VNIQLNNDFQFSNTAGFIFSFEAKTSSTADPQTAIRITVDSSFNVGLKNYGTRAVVTQANIYNANGTYIQKETGFGNPIYNTFRTFNIRFNYDENLALDNNNVFAVPSLLGTTGFKSFSNPSVLTIYSEYGASIRNLRMYAFY
jgi:hypothetical protein